METKLPGAPDAELSHPYGWHYKSTKFHTPRGVAPILQWRGEAPLNNTNTNINCMAATHTTRIDVHKAKLAMREKRHVVRLCMHLDLRLYLDLSILDSLLRSV